MLHSCALTLAAGALLCLMNVNLHPTHPTWVIPGSGPSTGFTPEQGMGSPSGNQVGVNGNLLDQLYIRFTENCGQIADSEGNPMPEVLYSVRSSCARVYLMRDRVQTLFTTYNHTKDVVTEYSDRQKALCGNGTGDRVFDTRLVSIRFTGSNPKPAISSAQPCNGYENFYLSHCPAGITRVKSYRQVKYHNLYDRVDLTWYASCGRELRYEFTVLPGGDPKAIRLRFTGVDQLYVDNLGNLHVLTAGVEQVHNAPRSFTADGQEVGSAFAIRGKSVSFVLAPYDTDQTLTVVPWGVHFGGSDEDFINNLSVSATGEIGITGSTFSLDFPVHNAFQTTHKDKLDMFISTFSAEGTLLWSTYLGGSFRDVGNDIAFNSIREVCIVGETWSGDFPLRNPYQKELTATTCAIAKFSPEGTLIWSTYYGGEKDDAALGCAIDPSDNILVAGTTASERFPAINSFQSNLVGDKNAVLFKLTSEGRPIWSTYLGGSGETDGRSVDIDQKGNIYHVGKTKSRSFPTLRAFQASLSGDWDLFVTKWTDEGRLIWSTYFGGTSYDGPYDIAITASGECIVVGETDSRDLPLKKALQSIYHGEMDGVVARFDSSGVLECATYLGGVGYDNLINVDADAAGNLFAAGETKSTDYPVRNSLQDTLRSWITDLALSSLQWSPDDGYQLNWATYFGTEALDYPSGIQIDPSGNIVVGGTSGGDFSVFFNWFSEESPPMGWYGGFLIRLYPNGHVTSATTSNSTPVGFTLHTPTPLPAHHEVCLRFELPASDQLRFDIFDILGRHIAVLQSSRWYAGGVNHLTVPLPEISTGVYFIRMQGLHAAVTTKLLID